MYHLQYRWKLNSNSLDYYGMRSKPYLFKNHLKISKQDYQLLASLPRVLTEHELSIIKPWIEQGIVVKPEQLKHPRHNLQDAQFCMTCVANDFIIPGLEFDQQGRCPMCQSISDVKDMKSVLPLINHIKKAKHSRFDIALFYTGGKDSSYLLYHLSKVLNLRVLALTWEIPFMSESARQSIENAKKRLQNVEFVTRKVQDVDLLKIYHQLYKLENNTCACPSLAYVLFYPLMVSEKVPYFVLGNEPVQMMNLYFNHLAPKAAYKKTNHTIIRYVVNTARLLTLRKPYKTGQFESIMTMRQLAYGDSILKKMSGYENTLVSHVTASLHEVPELLRPLKKSIRYSSLTGQVPAFVHVDFNDISGGHYDWNAVKQLIETEVGWVPPSVVGKGLHTSCTIEKCKEYTQFMNFFEMKTAMIPFSSIEISLASYQRHIDREQAISEINQHMGFTYIEVDECQIMKQYLNIIQKKTSEQ